MQSREVGHPNTEQSQFRSTADRRKPERPRRNDRAASRGAQVTGPFARRGRRRGGIRHPGRSDPAGLRPAVRLHEGPPHPGPPRAGRRARGRGLRAGHRQGRRVHGDLRTRAPPTWSPRSPTPSWTRCRSWPSPARSPYAVDRHRRLPGGRHLRHHAADHQAQLPGAARRADPADHRRGVPPGAHRPARARCWSTSPRTCCRPRPRSPGRRCSTCPATGRCSSRTASRSARRPS